MRIDGGTLAEKQIAPVAFLASPRSNRISGKLVESTDDWKRFEKENMWPQLFTLRRVQQCGIGDANRFRTSASAIMINSS